jgi:hypothetical protein
LFKIKRNKIKQSCYREPHEVNNPKKENSVPFIFHLSRYTMELNCSRYLVQWDTVCCLQTVTEQCNDAVRKERRYIFANKDRVRLILKRLCIRTFALNGIHRNMTIFPFQLSFRLVQVLASR